MADNVTDGGAADIYVEEVYGMQCAEQSLEKKDKDWRSFMQFYRSPPKISQDYNEAEGYMSGWSEYEQSYVDGSADDEVDGADGNAHEDSSDNDTSDEEYKQPPEDDSSADDE